MKLKITNPDALVKDPNAFYYALMDIHLPKEWKKRKTWIDVRPLSYYGDSPTVTIYLEKEDYEALRRLHEH